MEEFFLFLNNPLVLWSLLIGSVVLVLIDYIFPVDWPAYLGYLAFAMFIGATVPLNPLWSFLTIVFSFALLLVLHVFVFSIFLTNAPKYESASTTNDLDLRSESDAASITDDGESTHV